MLDKSLTIRTDALLRSWLNRLADQAGRTPTAFVRDMVYALILMDDQGQTFCEAIKSSGISYNK